MKNELVWLEPVWKTVSGKARMARRKILSVQKYVGEAALLAGAKTRGFHVAVVGKQYFVFQDPIDVRG